MTSSPLTPGQEVRVFDVNKRHPEGGWPGEVIKVGRKFVGIRYRNRLETFRMDTQSANDAYGHQFFRTMNQLRESAHGRAALAAAGAPAPWYQDWEPAGRDADGNLVLRYLPAGGLYRVIPVED